MYKIPKQSRYNNISRGTGALVGALKQEKQVIVVPRLAKFGEHSDDHQTQISSMLENDGYLKQVLEIKDLFGAITSVKSDPIMKKFNKQSEIVSIIGEFIERTKRIQ
ncbi:hypothetical protein KFZ58_15720 [Virgibacillus sp. NKC19-16]|nr:hypothetical protein KFZ58_15720 [Virgibacillus sp. NKC19-16]